MLYTTVIVSNIPYFTDFSSYFLVLFVVFHDFFLKYIT